MAERMSEQLQNINPIVLYVSLIAITVLALIRHLSIDETVSIIVVFLIVVISLGNISYIYNKFKKRVSSPKAPKLN